MRGGDGKPDYASNFDANTAALQKAVLRKSHVLIELYRKIKLGIQTQPTIYCNPVAHACRMVNKCMICIYTYM